MNTHVPRWNVEKARSDGLYYIVSENHRPGNVPIALILADEKEGENALTNAFLMAAAPALLAAAKYAISALERANSDDFHLRAAALLNAAIKESEGWSIGNLRS